MLDYLKTDAWPTVQNAILQNILAIVQPLLMSYLNPVAPGEQVPQNETISAKLREVFLKEETGILIQIRDKIVDDLLAKVTTIAQEYGITVPSKENLNAEGFKAALNETYNTLVDKVTDTLTEGLCDLDQLQTFLSGQVDAEPEAGRHERGQGSHQRRAG